ncbi:RDD family protein [Streptomyces sp. G45]|uniref:RDD family protein n=1 Tax=Streptomyces sp. G45 TaxID=3406627 RepID=UPI003C254067
MSQPTSSADGTPVAGPGLPPYPQPSGGWYAAPGPYPAWPRLAERGARLGARLLDLVFWLVGYFAVGIPGTMWIDESDWGLAQVVLGLWLAGSFVLYFPLSLSRFGSTLGKRVCGVRVVRAATGAPVGFLRAAGREFFWAFAAIVPVLSLLDPLWCCWDKPSRQCLHDKVAGTVVVTREAV